MRKHLPSKDLLRRLIWKDDLFGKDIAELYNVSSQDVYNRLKRFRIPTRNTLIKEFDYYEKNLSGSELRRYVKRYIGGRKLVEYRTGELRTFGIPIKVRRKKARFALKVYLEYLARRKGMELAINETTAGLSILGCENIRVLSKMFVLDWYDKTERFRKRISES